MRFDFTGDTQKGILFHLHSELTLEQYFAEVITEHSSKSGTGYESQKAIDFNSETYWHSRDFAPVGEYLILYLKSYYVNPIGFSITSSMNEPGDGVCHPKNWGFDASNDKKTWVHQINYTDQSGYLNRYAATEFVSWNYGTYKYFRFMVTGSQYDNENKNAIDLAQIELFGDLLSAIPRKYCSKYLSFSSALYKTLFFVMFL